jgi:hypothetical protein
MSPTSTTLTALEVERSLAGLPGWRVEDEALVRELKLATSSRHPPEAWADA